MDKMAKYIILNGKVYYIKLASNIISLFEELSHMSFTGFTGHFFDL